MTLLGRIPTREPHFPVSSPVDKSPNNMQFRSKSFAAHIGEVKNLQNYCRNTASQYALLIVDSHGTSQVYGSDAFQPHLDAWFADHVRSEAAQISVQSVQKCGMQQRSNGINYDKDDQSPRQLDIAADGDVDDDDEGNDEDGVTWADAEGEDENGDHSSRQQTPPQYGVDKIMRNALPPPPEDQRRMMRVNHRKRSLDNETTPGKKRRPTVKRNVRRSSSSGESGDVVLQEEVEYKGLDITNEEEVNTFFETRLRQMQQLVCKVVAKCWIKVIEPKKQSNFPYNRGEESKPSWWPANARHKEPDHLMKPERLRLLLTMLRCRKVPVSKLEAATAEATAHIPLEKAPLLEEIYRVAKLEERFLAGGLAPGTLCYVAASEKIVKSPNQKAPSPKMIGGGNSSSSPASSVHAGGSIRSNLGRRMSAASPDGQQLSPVLTTRDTNLRVAPRINTGDAIAPNTMPRLQPHNHNPFSGTRAQANIQPLNPTGALGYSTGAFAPQSSAVQEEQQEYMGNHQIPMYFSVLSHQQQQQQQQQQQHRHSVSHFPVQNTPHLRRSNTMPAVPQTSAAYQNWNSQIPNGMPNGSMVGGGGLYSPYSPSAQSQQSPHGPHHQVHGVSQTGSTPPTPVTASSYQQPMQLPPPLPPMHQHQQPLVTSPPHEIDGGENRNEHYSDFLASDLANAENSAGNVNDGQQAGPSK
ncbi:uncharacterized protein H6S33_012537 [Morchella sextelata]|uniref:uncharacterized protein n=1 Tax=Morchella sextelata TaxID=1174677 RepID=UPI001D044B5B|nr:uncharacterized protein H6S33_012537 [Morchella sextelata]KAH0609991.1 hypothetical protein H6S33_012537 [Morchella sextelata]